MPRLLTMLPPGLALACALGTAAAAEGRAALTAAALHGRRVDLVDYSAYAPAPGLLPPARCSRAR